MSALDPLLDAELSKDRAIVFACVRFEFADVTVQLVDGAAEVTPIGMGTFVGEHPLFGSIDEIDAFEDGSGDEAPGMVVRLLPATSDMSLVASAAMQGARVRVWLGAVERASGNVIGAPFLLFDGVVDVPTVEIGKRELAVEYECVSGMERYFANSEGIRLSASWHKQVFPGELGLDYVTGAARKVYWGQSAPSGVRR